MVLQHATRQLQTHQQHGTEHGRGVFLVPRRGV